MSYSLFAWIFTVGGIMGFLTMFFHSYRYRTRYSTFFIFGGGLFVSFLLEYTLSNIFNLYSYQNLPFVVLKIPIIIPIGWIITFYGLFTMSVEIASSELQTVVIAGLAGMLFGIGIESLADLSNFWVFYFESTDLLGIPVNVILAWGLTTANFALGILIFERNQDKENWIWVPLLLVIHLLNIGIAKILS